MMAEMEEYLFVGGPRDGARIATNGARIVVMPIVQPLEVFTKVTPIRRYREPSMSTTTYERFDRIYWWEGLVRDAFAEMVVSDQVLVEGGSTIRKFIRAEIRSHLASLAEGKELGRIRWRVVSRDFIRSQTTIRALVGPRAGPYGLEVRSQRRSGVSAPVR